MNDAGTASRPTPKYMANAAEKRLEATVCAKAEGLGPKGDLAATIGNSTEAEHTLPESWVELKGRGANLLALNENAPAARDLKDPISTLPLTTRAYVW